MKELTLDDVKNIEIEILMYIHTICHRNDITYFLDSGTLLGAVRHKGFIPWDDDIDIVMPRTDYERFLKVMESSEKYRVINYRNNDSYIQAFAKVYDSETIMSEKENMIEQAKYGVYVDIFPLDKLPDHRLQCKIFQFLINLKKRQIWSITFPDSRERLSFKILHFFTMRKKNYRYYLGKLDKFVQKYNRKNTETMWGPMASFDPYRRIPARTIRDRVELEFEGHFFDAMVGYEEYLSCMYGDYMKLPPKEQQVSNHSFTAYRK